MCVRAQLSKWEREWAPSDQSRRRRQQWVVSVGKCTAQAPVCQLRNAAKSHQLFPNCWKSAVNPLSCSRWLQCDPCPKLEVGIHNFPPAFPSSIIFGAVVDQSVCIPVCCHSSDFKWTAQWNNIRLNFTRHCSHAPVITALTLHRLTFTSWRLTLTLTDPEIPN